MSQPGTARNKPDETRIHIDLGDRGYDIVIGQGILGNIAAYLDAPARVALVTDQTVADLYLDRLGLDIKQPVIVPPGEDSKSFAMLEKVVGQLLDQGVERKTTLIALGGGVVGDLAGFAASIVLRGIPYIQVPTTLLAQVDSSVGGKTAVNAPQGKNLIGAFYQPRMVLVDTDTLKTLPKRELLAGYAEIVKYGLINNAAFFDWLQENGQKVTGGDAAAQKYAIQTSCETKAAIVAADEKESGVRALLNLGHTFGHALEAVGGYGALLHGEAVAIGMVMAFDLSARLGLCNPEEAGRVRTHLESAGLPMRLPFDTTPEALWEAMAHDKKVRDGKIIFILAKGIGKAFETEGVEKADVLDILKTWT